MAKDKKSFLLYADLIHMVNQLPNDKAGELFKHVLSYVNDEAPQTNDVLIKIAFEPIKQSLKRDLERYATTCKKNKENAEKRWNKNNATACDGIDSDANDADSDSDSDSDNDNERKGKRAKAQTDKIDFPKLKAFFNDKCVNLPNVKSITATRKGAVNARLKEYSKDDITEVIKLASKSKFLNGENDKGWRANFDWIFNPTNFAKIIEGNYSEQTESERHNLNLPEGVRIATKLDIEDCIGGYDAKKAIQSGKQYVYDKGVLLVQKDKEGSFYRNRDGKNIRL